jgi:death-on-curing protein
VNSQNNFNWIELDLVLTVHEAQIAEHGGTSGVRDAGLLASALTRPRNAAIYSNADACEIAAFYALGIIRDHPFIDGNKRVGAVLLETFLEDNGFEFPVEDSQLVDVYLQVADGSMSEEQFIGWVKKGARRR